MKKLDRLILFEIFPVFIISFLISAFVLMMQFMFLYIDEIAGKGVGIFNIMEFIFYLSLTFFPLALPISVLIASVMVYGALGERYELASIKSAGVSYQRMLYPTVIFSCFVAVFSYISSEYIIPVANVKSRSRLYDMSKKKPTLNIKEGVFNTDFDGYGIRIGKKNKDGSHIEDVILYDYNSNYKGASNFIIAKKGEMIITPDESAFILVLEDGKQYQEVQRYRQSRTSSEPYMVTHFERYQKVFDLSEFQLQSTNENYFKNHQSAMNSRELQETIDSTKAELQQLLDRVELEMAYDMPFIRSRILLERQKEKDSLLKAEERTVTKKDSAGTTAASDTAGTADTVASLPAAQTAAEPKEKTTGTAVKKVAVKDAPKRLPHEIIWEEMTPGFLDSLPKDSLLMEVITTRQPGSEMYSSLRSGMQSMKDQISYRSKQMGADRSRIVKSTYELHFKFALALACIIFALIGGAMGSIVRKGGFGYSLLISIVFFVTFIMMTILFRKTSEGYRLSPVLAAYLPDLILLPVGLFLVYKAVNDSKLALDFTRIGNLIRRWSGRFRQRRGRNEIPEGDRSQ